MLYNGIGGSKDLDEALKYGKMAAAQGKVEHIYCYATICQESKRDLEEAFKNFQIAADQGHAPSQNSLALLYYKGECTPRNYEKAFYYSKLSAEKEDSLGRHNYAFLLYNGKKGEQDLQQARKLFKIGAEQGDIESSWNYALMCYKEEGGPQDLQEAIKYCKFTLAQGVEEALLLLNELEGLLGTSYASTNLTTNTTSNADENVTLTLNFPTLKNNSLKNKEEDHSSQTNTTKLQPVGQTPGDEKNKISLLEEESGSEEDQLEKELEKLQKNNEQEYAQLRAKKHAQKEAAIQALLISKQTYKHSLKTLASKGMHLTPTIKKQT